jgi:uncharacterized RDD family membrane protein YckC
MAMADDQQQPGQPPAGAPGSWPPPAQPQNAFTPPGQPAWGQAPQQPQQPQAWGQAPQQPPQPQAWGQQPQQPQQPQAWGQQPGSMPGYQPPAPGGYPPPPYGAPGGFPPPGYGYGPNYAGFWIRLVAFIIDAFILLAITIVLAITVIGLLLVIPVGLGYMPFLWYKRGGTFGQTLLGLRVVRAIDGGPIDGGMAMIRALVFWAEQFFSGWLIGLLGFVWAAFEPRKRAWHDMAAGTVVIHVN